MHIEIPGNTIIRIFGYSGVGKGTLAKQLSSKLNLPNLDTGKYWRAITVWYLSQSTTPTWDQEAISQAFKAVQIRIVNQDLECFLGEHQLSFDELRNPHVNQTVAQLSSHPFARSLFYDGLYRMIHSQNSSLISDGRGASAPYLDMLEQEGWKIIRFKLQADVHVAAQRRAIEMIEVLAKDDPSVMTHESKQAKIHEETLQDLIARNKKDEDAWKLNNIVTDTDDMIVIDTSQLTIDQVLETALAKITETAL